MSHRGKKAQNEADPGRTGDALGQPPVSRQGRPIDVRPHITTHMYCSPALCNRHRYRRGISAAARHYRQRLLPKARYALRQWIWLCALVSALAATPSYSLADGATRPTYPQVQSAWAKVLGFSFAIVLWHEECSARESSPSVRKVLSQSFERWKARNSYMDELRERVYRRARLEGGDAEATRLAKQLQSLMAEQEAQLRADIRSGGSWECSRFLYVVDRGQSDLSVAHKENINILRRAID